MQSQQGCASRFTGSGHATDHDAGSLRVGQTSRFPSLSEAIGDGLAVPIGQIGSLDFDCIVERILGFRLPKVKKPMPRPEMFHLADFSTHRTKTVFGLLFDKFVRDAGNAAGKFQKCLASFVVAGIRRNVITHSLEIRGSILNRPQAKHAFHDENGGVTFNTMTQSQKPPPERKQIPQRRVPDGQKEQNSPNDRASNNRARHEHQKGEPSRSRQRRDGVACRPCIIVKQ